MKYFLLIVPETLGVKNNFWTFSSGDLCASAPVFRIIITCSSRVKWHAEFVARVQLPTKCLCFFPLMRSIFPARQDIFQHCWYWVGPWDSVPVSGEWVEWVFVFVLILLWDSPLSAAWTLDFEAKPPLGHLVLPEPGFYLLQEGELLLLPRPDEVKSKFPLC